LVVGFLDLFKDPEENHCRRIHTRVYRMSGMSPGEAEELFKKQFAEAKAEVAKGGRFVAPEKHGSTILARAPLDAKLGAYVATIRADGVRDKDILWFWNMPCVIRVMMMKDWERAITASMLNELSSGKSPQEAFAITRKFHPYYGHPVDEEDGFSGADRRIPAELKDRVDIYIERRGGGDIEAYRAELLQGSSFNSLIRNEITAGRI
jgi:hypothetical protein